MVAMRAAALTIFCIIASVSGARIKRRTVHKSGVDCATLGSVRAGNKSFEELTKWVCGAWPPAFGSFPVQKTMDFANLLELAFGKGGVWEDMKSIWNMRRSRRFCWRNETLREIIPAESNMKCQMEVNGTCYGQCPRGYKRGSLLGLFKPVCTTVCADSFHNIPCGFGCATSRLGCLQTILDQVGTVAKQVTRVAGFITGNPAVAAIVDKVITIVEFMVEVLPKILVAIKNVYKYISKGQKELAFFMLLFQFVSEVYPYGYNSREMWDLKEKMTPVMEYILEIVDGDLGNIIDLGIIRDTIVNHGSEILDAITIITKAFEYKKCGEMARTTMFTIEDAGEEEAVGSWVQFYETNKRPRYALSTDNQWLMEYSKSKKEWRMLSPPNWVGMRKVLYRNPVENSDYPLEGWVAKDGALPIPEPYPAQFTCNALEQMVVKGRGFGSVAGVVCQFWPESLGPFPLNEEQKAFDILDKAFGDGGLWDQIDEIRKSRHERPDFCWRKESERAVIASGQGCKLVSEGVCYGECPWGYKRSLLTGRFAPVCTSSCGESQYSFPCGFGCSSGLGSCLDNVKDQVGELTRFLGDVAQLAFDNPNIGEVVEKVTYIVEFLLQVLPKFVEKAKVVWAGVREDEAEVALVMVVFQYIKELGTFDSEFEVLRDNMGEILEVIQKLIQTNFEWDEVNMDLIKDILASATDKVLDAMVGLTKNFLYKRCEPADSQVHFAIDEAGDQDILGLWIAEGESNGRPRYELRTNGRISLEWRENSWQIRSTNVVFTKRTLYQSNVDSAKPPTEGWEVVRGSEPLPLIIALKE